MRSDTIVQLLDDVGQPPSPTSHLGHLRELLCHREEVLSVLRIVFSESAVFYLVFWMSSCVVFVWVVFVFGVCFVSTLENTWPFAFNLFS